MQINLDKLKSMDLVQLKTTKSDVYDQLMQSQTVVTQCQTVLNEISKLQEELRKKETAKQLAEQKKLDNKKNNQKKEGGN